MKINYIENIISQDIDINHLRPNKSYDYLINNRTASLNSILKDKEKLSKYLKDRHCPMCNREDFRFLYEKDSLNIVQCNNCQLVYVNPVFNHDKYIEIYKDDNYQKIVKRLGEDSHDYRRQRFGIERMDFIEKYHQNDQPKRLLEIGSSTGFLLEEAKNRGWDAIGLELNPSAAAFARKRGINTIEKSLEEIEFSQKFSVVCLFDVLEHLLYPRDILIRIYDILYENGNVFIYVPNYNSASRMLLGVENAHFIWPTHHLTYFTPNTLKQFLETINFKIFHWETQGLDLYDWQWYLKEKNEYDTRVLEENIETLQFFINASGYGKNLRMFARKEKN